MSIPSIYPFNYFLKIKRLATQSFEATKTLDTKLGAAECVSVPLPVALQHYAGTASRSRFPGCSSLSPGSSPGSSGMSEPPVAETCCDSPTGEKLFGLWESFFKIYLTYIYLTFMQEWRPWISFKSKRRNPIWFMQTAILTLGGQNCKNRGRNLTHRQCSLNFFFNLWEFNIFLPVTMSLIKQTKTLTLSK